MNQQHTALFLQAIECFPYELVPNGELEHHAYSIARRYRTGDYQPILGFAIQCGGVVTLALDEEANARVTCCFYLVVHARKLQPVIVGEFNQHTGQWSLRLNDQPDESETE
jgi:hypothetical protein